MGEVTLKNFVSTFDASAGISDVCHYIKVLEEYSDNSKECTEAINEVLKKFVAHLEKNDESKLAGFWVRSALLEACVRTWKRKNLSNYMYQQLKKTSFKEQPLFENFVAGVLYDIEEHKKKKNVFNIPYNLKVLIFLANFIDNFSEKDDFTYLFKKVFPYYKELLNIFDSLDPPVKRNGQIEQKGILQYSDCYEILDMALHQLALALPRTRDFQYFADYSVHMLVKIHDIMSHNESLKLETLTRCAVIFSFFANCLPEEEKEKVRHKDIPLMDYVWNKPNQYDLFLKTKALKNIFSGNSTMQLIINLCIYQSIEHNTLLHYVDALENETILESLYTNLMKLSDEQSTDDEVVKIVSCTLVRMSQHLAAISNFDRFFSLGLIYCWKYLNHSLDLVVRNTRSLLFVLLKEANKKAQDGDVQYMQLLRQDLKQFKIHSKIKSEAIFITSGVVHPATISSTFPHIRDYLSTCIQRSINEDMAYGSYNSILKNMINLNIDSEEVLDWTKHLLVVLLRDPRVKHHNSIINILQNVYQSKPDLLSLFITRMRSNDEDCLLVMKCLIYARQHALKLNLPKKEEKSYWRNLILKERLKLLLFHQSEEVQVSGLAALVNCQQTTESLTDFEVTCIVTYIQYNLSPQLASTRSKTVQLLKKFLSRHDIGYVYYLKTSRELYEKIMKLSGKQMVQKVRIQEYFDFIKKTLDHYLYCFVAAFKLILRSINRDANHPRRSISLELLLYMYKHQHKYIKQRGWNELFDEDDIENIKHILHDNYDSNKKMAVELLKTFPPTKIGFSSEAETKNYYQESFLMACDIKPCQSLTAMHRFEVVLSSPYPFKDPDEVFTISCEPRALMILDLYEQLEVMLIESAGDVHKSAAKPFYGLLMSCRHLLQKRDTSEDNKAYETIYKQLVGLSLRVAKEIMPVVCNSAPEGFIFDSDEDNETIIESQRATQSQKILVFSWRTMKEVMSLLAEIVRQVIGVEQYENIFNNRDMVEIADFFLEVFVHSKHRGVFEQAGVAFQNVCNSFLRSENEFLHSLPRKWLEKALRICTEKEVSVCATRRSAGLPFLILSVLCPLAANSTTHVVHTMEHILSHTDDSHPKETRIHCLNVLRAVFKNSKLNDHTSKYIDRGAIFALQGFQNQDWGIRNSSTLFFATIITKIFGVPNRNSNSEEIEENRLTTGTFALRHKELFEFLLKTLKEECENNSSLILHPVLLILSRLSFTPTEFLNAERKQEIDECIERVLQNSMYTTRELAAKASVSLLSEPELKQKILTQFQKIASQNVSDSLLHGILLQLLHIFKATFVRLIPISAFIKYSSYILSETGKTHSHLTVACYMDLLYLLLAKYRIDEDLYTLKIFAQLLEQTTLKNIPINTCRASFTFSRFRLFVCLLVHKLEHVGPSYVFVKDLIYESLFGEDNHMKKQMMLFLIDLHQKYSTERFRVHPLIISGDVIIPENIQTLVNPLSDKIKKEILSFIHHRMNEFFYDGIFKKQQEHTLCVLYLLLVRFYPCFFNMLKVESMQVILDCLLTTYDSHDEIVSAVLLAVKSFLMAQNHEKLKTFNYNQLIQVVGESASPNASDFRRLAAAQFLVETQALYKNKVWNDVDKYNVANIVMVLLEDDEAIVRNTISLFASEGNYIRTEMSIHSVEVFTSFEYNVRRLALSYCPCRARAVFVAELVYIFNNFNFAVAFLTGWAIRHLPEVTRNKATSEVYDRGEMNTYAENIPVTECATRHLFDVLKRQALLRSVKVPDMVIFMAEKIHTALKTVQTPMVDKKTKKIVMGVLKDIVTTCASYNMVKNCTDSEPGTFKAYFEKNHTTRILPYLRKTLGNDYPTVQTFFYILFRKL